MIAQNNILDFLIKNTSEPVNRQRAEKPDSKSFLGFKDIMESTLGRSDPKADFKPFKTNVDLSGNSQAKSIDNQKFAYKPSKDVGKIDNQQSKTDIADAMEKAAGNGNAGETGDDKKGIKENKKIKAFIESFASVMGIKPEELIKLISMMGVKPEELMDASRQQTIVDKLSGLLNLNADLKKSLEDVFKMISGQFEDAAGIKDLQQKKSGTGQDSSGITKPDNGWMKLRNENITVHSVKQPEIAIDAVAAQLKAKLEELSAENLQNPQKLQQEIAEKIKKVMSELDTEKLTAGKPISEN